MPAAKLYQARYNKLGLYEWRLVGEYETTRIAEAVAMALTANVYNASPVVYIEQGGFLPAIYMDGRRVLMPDEVDE